MVRMFGLAGPLVGLVCGCHLALPFERAAGLDASPPLDARLDSASPDSRDQTALVDASKDAPTSDRRVADARTVDLPVKDPGGPVGGEASTGIVVMDNSPKIFYSPSAISLTWPHTVGTSPNRMLVVTVAIFGSATVTTAEANSTSLTTLSYGCSHSPPNGAPRVEIWLAKNPQSGPQTIKVTLSTATAAVARSMSFGRVKLTTTPVCEQGGAGSSILGVAWNWTAAVGDWVLDAVAVTPEKTLTAYPIKPGVWSQPISGVGTAGGASFSATATSGTNGWLFGGTATGAQAQIVLPHD